MSARLLTAAALVGLVVGVASCVELTGQRIAWFHDEAQDELRLLIFYDGIHDSYGNDPDRCPRRSRCELGSEQIPVFVANGDVMLLDWYFHFRRRHLERTLKDRTLPEEARAFAEHLTRIRVVGLGHFEEPEGRVGAVQWVVVPEVSELMRRANAALNRLYRDELEDVPLERQVGVAAPRTQELWLQAARDGHTWLRLDGHAFVFEAPVDRGEWPRIKRFALEAPLRAFVRWATRVGGFDDEEFSGSMRALLDAVSSVPLSYVEEAGRVRAVAGLRDEPSLARIHVRPATAYEPSLQDVVREHAGGALHEVYAVVDGFVPNVAYPSPMATDLASWGPPEAHALALVSAIDALRSAHGAPPPPALDDRGDPPDAYARSVLRSRRSAFEERAGLALDLAEDETEWDIERWAWLAWYRAVRRGGDLDD